MAKAVMLKAFLLGHAPIRNRLIDDLHKLGIMEISEIRKEEGGPGQDPVRVKKEAAGLEKQLQDIDRIIQGLQSTLKILENAGTGKGPSPAALLGEMTQEEYLKKARSFPADIAEKVKGIADRIGEKETRAANDRARYEELLPWKSIKVNLRDALISSGKVGILFGAADTKTFAGFREKVSSESFMEISPVHSSKEKVYFALFYMPSVSGDLPERMKNANIRLVDLGDAAEGVPRALERLRGRIEEAEKEEEALKKELRQYTLEHANILICLDYWKGVYEKEEIRKMFLHTDKTFLLSGWIMKKHLKHLETLKARYTELHVATGLPAEGEEPPVALENTRIVSPFEMVTKLFGLPSPSDVDPTPLFTPFFILYFAICITDAGYGLVLLVASLLFLRRRYLSPGVRKLMGVMAISGLATIFVGAAAGGFFGIQFEQLPESMRAISRFKEKMAFLDPLKYPMRLFILVMALGLFQITTGIVIRFILQLRDKNYRAAVVESFSWLLVIIGLVLAVMLKNRLLWLLPAAGAVIIVLFTSESRNIFIRILSGLYSFYGITGLFGDVVSHARLFALALSTSVIAMVINVIVGIVYGLMVKIPVVGFPLGIAVLAGGLIFGHIFDILINSLGGFIHTTRLQFVEYFTKFYAGGGMEFTPFKEKTDYVHLKS